jgi:hypothetical protein
VHPTSRADDANAITMEQRRVKIYTFFLSDLATSILNDNAVNENRLDKVLGNELSG